jgi:hypothetical protein
MLVGAGDCDRSPARGHGGHALRHLGAGDARVFWTMFLLSTGATLLGLLLVIGAAAVVSLRTHLFPRWFTAASALLALVSVVGAFTIGYASDGVQVVAGVALLLDGIWIGIVSLYLWRPRRTES